MNREPFGNFDLFREDIDRLMRLMQRRPSVGLFPLKGWQPAINLYETPERIVIQAELAGIPKESIGLSLEGRKLILTGKREDVLCGGGQEGKMVHLLEIQSGRFERAVILPHAVKVDRAEARLKDGILEVILPKQVRTEAPTGWIRIEFKS